VLWLMATSEVAQMLRYAQPRAAPRSNINGACLLTIIQELKSIVANRQNLGVKRTTSALETATSL